MLKKILCVLLIMFLITGCLKKEESEPTVSLENRDNSSNTETSPSSENALQNQEENVLVVYEGFLNGEIEAESNEGMIRFEDGDIRFVGERPDLGIYDKKQTGTQFVLFDMSGDGAPELLIEYGGIYIFVYNNGKLSLWWSDKYWSGYSIILENGDILHMRLGAAPTHTTYHYLVMDESGGEKEHTIFEKYDSDEDGIYDFFTVDNDELPLDEWEQETEQYVFVKEIEWKEYVTTESLLESTKPYQSLKTLDISDFSKPEYSDIYPTIDEFASYLQRNIDFYGAQINGNLEYYLWERYDNPSGIAETKLLAYPVLAPKIDDWDYYGVDIFRGEIYRWRKDIEKRRERVVAQEVFPTPLSALEYFKDYYMGVATDQFPFDFKLAYGQDDTPYYYTQKMISPDGMEISKNITMDRQFDDGYTFRVRRSVVDSQGEGVAWTYCWLSVYKNGFVLDEFTQDIWIVSERR